MTNRTEQIHQKENDITRRVRQKMAETLGPASDGKVKPVPKEKKG